VEGVRHVLHGVVGEECLARFGDSVGWVPARGGAANAGVGDEEIDEAGLGGDGVDGGLDRVFGGDVALDGDEDRGVFFDHFLEDLQASAEEVDLGCAVGGEGARHHQADA